MTVRFDTWVEANSLKEAWEKLRLALACYLIGLGIEKTVYQKGVAPEARVSYKVLLDKMKKIQECLKWSVNSRVYIESADTEEEDEE